MDARTEEITTIQYQLTSLPPMTNFMSLDALPNPDSVRLLKTANSSSNFSSFEMKDSNGMLSIRMKEVPVALERPYDEPGCEPSQECVVQVAVPADLLQKYEAFLRTVASAAFPNEPLEQYITKTPGVLRTKLTSKERSCLVSRRRRINGGTENKRLRFSQSDEESDVRAQLFGETVHAHNMMFKACFYKINGKFICSLRVQELNFAALTDVPTESLSSATVYSSNNPLGFLTVKDSGPVMVVRGEEQGDTLKVTVFEPTEEMDKFSVLISVPDSIAVPLSEACRAMAGDADFDFKNPLLSNDQYGFQLKCNTKTLPEGLVSSGTVTSCTFLVKKYAFSNQAGDPISGAFIQLVAVESPSNEKSQKSDGGAPEYMDLDSIQVSDICWTQGRSEGTFIASIGLGKNQVLAMEPGFESSLINNPVPSDDLMEERNGDIFKVKSDEPIDMFMVPEQLQGCDQVRFLTTLDQSARKFCDEQYNKEFGQPAPWQPSISEGDDSVMPKLKIKSVDVPALDAEGRKIKIQDVTKTRGSFRAKVAVWPRIYAPHLKSQVIKKGKGALKRGEAKLNLQLVHLAMMDELKSSVGGDLEKALGYTLS